MQEAGYKDQTQPMDYVAAVTASRLASQDQAEAEEYLAEKSEEFADAERDYRKLLAIKLVELRSSGMQVSIVNDVARGDDGIVEAKHRRDLAKGLVEAAKQSIWRHTADRKDLEQFLEWSKRASFLDTQRQPEFH